MYGTSNKFNKWSGTSLILKFYEKIVKSIAEWHE